LTDEAEGLRRQRVQRMNHTMRRLGTTAPAQVTYHHSPDCPQGSGCWCTRKWVRL
jgi:hypothetical protein